MAIVINLTFGMVVSGPGIGAWIAPILLLAISAGCIVITYGAFLRWLQTKKSGAGMPFLGGAAGALGLLLLPITAAKHFWPVPIIIDPAVVFGVPWLFGRVIAMLSGGRTQGR